MSTPSVSSPSPKPNPIPEGHRTVTPFLRVNDAARLVEFLKQAFGATIVFRMNGPGGTVVHAEMKIGDSMIMIGQSPSGDAAAMCSMVHLYVPDTDAVYKSAIAAGATSIREPANQFYGDRGAGVRDFCGNEWWIATHIEDVSKEEMERRMAAMSK
jgi:PhnB protein